ncbi:MAG TPA: DUF1844 domain-containing protein [Pyrinomonadaceae bacterium]|jgi:hypothetical protein
MSEEQPVFKVTDRRLFNPDGTPREGAREEEKKEPAAAVTQEPAPAAAAAASASESAQPAREGQTSAPAREPAAEAGAAELSPAPASSADAAAEPLPEDDYAEGDIPGADDPASFINFLMSIASNAAAALGMMEHPVTGERRADPELAKHWIDVLGMLRQKTRGNLAPQEEQIFEGLLADLRMQYVSLASAGRPKSPRGFSGSDITGGK